MAVAVRRQLLEGSGPVEELGAAGVAAALGATACDTNARKIGAAWAKKSAFT
jgi:hypothetical protein